MRRYALADVLLIGASVRRNACRRMHPDVSGLFRALVRSPLCDGLRNEWMNICREERIAPSCARISPLDFKEGDEVKPAIEQESENLVKARLTFVPLDEIELYEHKPHPPCRDGASGSSQDFEFVTLRVRLQQVDPCDRLFFAIVVECDHRNI